MSDSLVRPGIVNVTLVVNTDYLADNYPHPSQNSSAPTAVNSSSVCAVAICGNTISSTESGPLIIQARPGSFVKWFGISKSSNFDNEVVLYDIVPYTRSPLFSKANFVRIDNPMVIPPLGYPTNPPTQEDMPLWYMASSILMPGQEVCQMQFALYTDDENGDRTLFGYFQWAVQVEVRWGKVKPTIA